MALNPGSVCPIACRRCKVNLIVERREFKGIKDRYDSFSTTEIIYHLHLTCPKKLGFFGLFYSRHDARIFSEDCSEEYISTD